MASTVARRLYTVFKLYPSAPVGDRQHLDLATAEPGAALADPPDVSTRPHVAHRSRVRDLGVLHRRHGVRTARQGRAGRDLDRVAAVQRTRHATRPRPATIHGPHPVTAYPSIAELSNDGTATSARNGDANTTSNGFPACRAACLTSVQGVRMGSA